MGPDLNYKLGMIRHQEFEAEAQLLSRSEERLNKGKTRLSTGIIGIFSLGLTVFVMSIL